jgi:CheY-like chemotaxis protein
MSEILILASDADLTSAYRRILESAGYHVVGVTNGWDAIDVMRNDRPDLVLLPVGMSNNLEGIDVSREIEADPDLQSIPIVIIGPTGKHPAKSIHSGRALFAAQIPDQAQPTALLATVRRFVN